MSRAPLTVPAGRSVSRLSEDHALRHRVSAFPVVDPSGRLRGPVTLNRIKRVQPALRSSSFVEDIACPVAEVPTAAPTDRLLDLLPAMAHGGDGRVVVIDDEHIVWILTSTDVTRAVELAELRARLAEPAPRTGRDALR